MYIYIYTIIYIYIYIYNNIYLDPSKLVKVAKSWVGSRSRHVYIYMIKDSPYGSSRSVILRFAVASQKGFGSPPWTSLCKKIRQG